MDSILIVAYRTGDSLYQFDQYDLALPILNQIMKLYDAHIQVKSIDYQKATGDLAMIYTKSDKCKNRDSAMHYFSKSIDFGNQDFDQYRLLISGFYLESRTFWMPLLDKMNKKLYENNADSLYTIKTVLRLMYLCDQIPRDFIHAGQKGFLPHSYTQISDSLNRHILGYLIDNKLISKFSDLGFESAYIELFLLHSILNGNLAFFEKYFTIYVSNNEWGLKSYKFLIGSYLNRTRQTQCYGTVKDRLLNGKFDFVPIENSDTIRKILSEKLNIEPKYLENFK